RLFGFWRPGAAAENVRMRANGGALETEIQRSLFFARHVAQSSSRVTLHAFEKTILVEELAGIVLANAAASARRSRSACEVPSAPRRASPDRQRVCFGHVRVNEGRQR